MSQPDREVLTQSAWPSLRRDFHWPDLRGRDRRLVESFAQPGGQLVLARFLEALEEGGEGLPPAGLQVNNQLPGLVSPSPRLLEINRKAHSLRFVEGRAEAAFLW